MGYSSLLQEMFPDLNPEVGDLFLLEAHQVAGLPERVPAPELAAVLHAHPGLRRFLVLRHPPVEGFLAQLLADHGPVGVQELISCEQAVMWEIADWIVYQRAPDTYESRSAVDWDVRAVTEVTALEDRSVIDAGAGTGRVAFDVAPMARHVFAVEPVATLRQYMRDKASRLVVGNLFVMDGLLSDIPLPAGSADVLLTCQAIGWALSEELAEIERVVRPGGTAIHLFGAASATQADNPLFDTLVANGYRPDTYEEGQLLILRYWKQLG